MTTTTEPCFLGPSTCGQSAGRQSQHRQSLLQGPTHQNFCRVLVLYLPTTGTVPYKVWGLESDRRRLSLPSSAWGTIQALFLHEPSGVCFPHSTRNKRFKEANKCTHRTADSGETETHTSQRSQKRALTLESVGARQRDKVNSEKNNQRMKHCGQQSLPVCYHVLPSVSPSFPSQLLDKSPSSIVWFYAQAGKMKVLKEQTALKHGHVALLPIIS